MQKVRLSNNLVLKFKDEVIVENQTPKKAVSNKGSKSKGEFCIFFCNNV